MSHEEDGQQTNRFLGQPAVMLKQDSNCTCNKILQWQHPVCCSHINAMYSPFTILQLARASEASPLCLSEYCREGSVLH